MWNNYGLGYIVIISAPSASGKTTLCRMLLQNNGDQMIFSRSCTTRPRRHNESAESYYFISPDDFKQRIQANEFLEWAVVHEHYYGTLKSQVNDGIQKRQIVLLEIDVQGGIQVMEKISESLSIFILPPSWAELHKRLKNRQTESEEEINLRLWNSKTEIDRMNRYQYIIINDRLDEAYHQILSIIQGHSLRFSNYSPAFLQQFQSEVTSI